MSGVVIDAREIHPAIFRVEAENFKVVLLKQVFDMFAREKIERIGHEFKATLEKVRSVCVVVEAES